MASRALKNGRGRRASALPGILIGVAALALASLVALGAIGVSLCALWLQDLPDYADTSIYEVAEPTRVYASDGETLLAEFQLEWRDPVTLDQVSPFAVEATIAIEDERFYNHAGVDVIGIGRALINNVFGGSLEGASTITQQFVRNTVLADEMTDISLKRKVREAYIALQLERLFEKDEILSLYLNTINYGQGAYGIEAASQRYFSKHAADLTLAEAAALAAIPQAPSYNNPIDGYDACLARRNLVLDRMVEVGFATAEEAAQAQAQPIELNPTAPSTTGIKAYPYFTSYVRNQLLDADGGHGFSVADIFEGGLTVITTLDVSMQESAQQAADAKTEGLAEAFEVSLVAIDPDNGHIKALIGGKDYAKSQVNMATGEGGSGRQAGSAFKTFTLVAAIEAGVNPNTLIDAGSTARLPGWTVSNIDRRNYGTRTIASAYQVSSNTAFARLALSIGTESVVDMAQRLGITAPLTTTGSVTLGVDSVTPLDMASAYATIANGGTYYKPECVMSVTNAAGETLIDNASPQGQRVVSNEVAYAAIEVMQGVVSEGTGTAARLSSEQPVAGKTGTSEKYKDSWFCGFTPQLSVAIWLGDRSDYATALSLPAGVTAASTFSDFMSLVLKDQPIEQFPEAEEPAYQSRYVDAKYHIGAVFNTSPETGEEKDHAEESPDEEAADKGNTPEGEGDFSAGEGEDGPEDAGSGSNSGSGSGAGSGAGTGGGEAPEEEAPPPPVEAPEVQAEPSGTLAGFMANC